MSEKMVIDNETKDLVKRLSRFYSGVVHDILDNIGIPGLFKDIKLMGALPEAGKICAPAVTLQMRKSYSKIAQWEVYEAIDIGDGHILVIDSDGSNGGTGSVFGGLMSTGAKINGLLGTIVDGSVRDIEEVKKIGYPLYAKKIEPITTFGRLICTGLNVTIECAGIKVSSGDVIFADLDGAVRVPRHALGKVVEMGEKLFNEENSYERDIKKGIPLMKVFANMEGVEENIKIKNYIRP